MEDGTWRDWSGLPAELIHLISKKLPDLPDFVRMRVVCKQWRSAAPHSDPPQLPWVLEHCTPEEGNLRFYSLATRKIYKIQVQEPYKKRLLGPGHRYLLELSFLPRKLSLSNPITQGVIRLPPRPPFTLPGNEGFGQNMIQSGDNMMILEGWDWVSTRKLDWILAENSFCEPMYYYMGKVFVQQRNGPTDVLDPITSEDVLYSMASPVEGARAGLKYSKDYLVESAGEFLRVHQTDAPVSVASEFDIFRLEFGVTDGNNACWVRISMINDQMLFLSERRGLSLSANKFCGFKGNSIYYFGKVYSTFELRRYDIETGATEVLPCPFEGGSTWLVPSLD